MGGEPPVRGTSVYGVIHADDWSQGPGLSHIAGAAVQRVFELVPTVFPSAPSPRKACVDMITCAPNLEILDGPPQI